MINPLSCQKGTRFSGKMINDWLYFQITNHGSHEKIARKIKQHFILKNDRMYELIYLQYRPSEMLYPGFMRVNI